MSETVRVVVDWDNNAEEWWDAARAAKEPTMTHDARRRLRVLLGVGSDDTIRLTLMDATKLLAWAEALPGWRGGPSHAPNPLVFQWTEEG